MKRMPQITSFILFIALCVSAAYWTMQSFNPPLRVVSAPPPTTQHTAGLDASTSLFGGRVYAVAASNFQLQGVVMASNPAESVAILVASGKKPQAVRNNAEVAPGITVTEVQRDHVLISERGVIKRLELPVKPMNKINATTSPTTTKFSAPSNLPGYTNRSNRTQRNANMPRGALED